MSELHPLPIGGERITTADEIVIRSPFDGAELGRVPKAGPGDVDAAVRAARTVLHDDPLRAWQRAEILDTAARRIEARQEDLARRIASEAAKPIKTARIEAARARPGRSRSPRSKRAR